MSILYLGTSNILHVPSVLKTVHILAGVETLQFVVPSAHSNQYKYSFLPLTIERWNGLNFNVNSCNTLIYFKDALMNY